MKLDNIQKFIELAKNEGVSELKYEDKEFKISVNFSHGKAVQPVAHYIPEVNSGAPKDLAAGHSTASNENFHVITSPFVGTYYSSPAPGEPTFVNVGDKINAGKTLCILEAMKIMNEIESDVSGEVVEICVENESLVEYGQALFKIRK